MPRGQTAEFMRGLRRQHGLGEFRGARKASATSRARKARLKANAARRGASAQKTTKNRPRFKPESGKLGLGLGT